MAQTKEGAVKPSLKESWVKQEIKKILKARGAVYCMPATGGFGKSGVSDFIVCYQGYFIAIEAKAGKGKTTALQDKWLENVTEAEGISLVVNEENINSVNVALNVVDRLLVDIA